MAPGEPCCPRLVRVEVGQDRGGSEQWEQVRGRRFLAEVHEPSVVPHVAVSDEHSVDLDAIARVLAQKPVLRAQVGRGVENDRVPVSGYDRDR